MFSILFSDLKEKLDYAITHQIPVFMVVAVIGSTEESSVDDLDQILKYKNEYEVKVRMIYLMRS